MISRDYISHSSLPLVNKPGLPIYIVLENKKNKRKLKEFGFQT